MFIIPDGTKLYSFEETATTLGCNAGLLRNRFDHPIHREVDDTDHATGEPAKRREAVPDTTSGFRALTIDIYVRLVRESGFAGKVRAPAGFDDVVRFDEVERESGLSGPAFADLLDELGINEITVRALTKTGHAWALKNMAWLAGETPPPDVRGASAVREWLVRKDGERVAA